MIRPVTAKDIDWIMATAKASYPPFNEAASRMWLDVNMNNPNIKMIRGEKGCALGAINSPFYAPSVRRGYQVFLVSEPKAGFEPCLLLRHLVDWAFKEKGAQSFHFGAEPGCDLSVFAKRIRAQKDGDSYRVTA